MGRDAPLVEMGNDFFTADFADLTKILGPAAERLEILPPVVIRNRTLTLPCIPLFLAIDG